jgi:hypothetical protein
MCTRLIIYPYKVILTWFRPIPKPKPETIGLKGHTGQWPPFSRGKEFYSISVIEGWPPLVFYLPGSQVTCVSNRAEGGQLNQIPRLYSLKFLLQKWPFWGGGHLFEPLEVATSIRVKTKYPVTEEFYRNEQFPSVLSMDEKPTWV